MAMALAMAMAVAMDNNQRRLYGALQEGNGKVGAVSDAEGCPFLSADANKQEEGHE